MSYCVAIYRGQKGVLDPLELPTMGAKNQTQVSGRAASVLKGCADSLS